ncbi:response regulator FixJ [Acidocella sp.]|uniref:response regulator FixJ n=1 Tax=Acidocella sp. TaxID=50710 RepID=UPI002615831E|nr:response regulator FixJ [Acidocella sp.]
MTGATAPVVHIVDDDEAVRAALAFLLGAEGFAVRAFDSGVAFLDGLETMQPGCVVTDVRMPGLGGLDLQRELLKRRIALPVIVMTGHGDVKLAVEAMKAGAVDFLEKPFAPEAMLEAVRGALARYSEAAREAGVMAAVKARLEALTARERDVLEGLLAGLPNKSIAHDLGISARTVEVYRAGLMTKMGAANLPDLLRMVLMVRPAGL